MKMTELEAAKSAIDGAKYCANTAGEIAEKCLEMRRCLLGYNSPILMTYTLI